jgi:hypothetical protein
MNKTSEDIITYPIIYKCRFCKKEFDFLDKILIHFNTHDKFDDGIRK